MTEENILNKGNIDILGKTGQASVDQRLGCSHVA